jgi:hypothetical protein
LILFTISLLFANHLRCLGVVKVNVEGPGLELQDVVNKSAATNGNNSLPHHGFIQPEVIGAAVIVVSFIIGTIFPLASFTIGTIFYLSFVPNNNLVLFVRLWGSFLRRNTKARL